MLKYVLSLSYGGGFEELISMLCKLSMTRISPRGYYTAGLYPKEVPFSGLKLINERLGPEICH